MVSNIWVAAADNKIDEVKKLIESKEFSANSKDVNGYTPIHAAVSYGHLDLLDYLISQGGDINIVDEEGDTPLHHAEDAKVAQYLVEKLGANHKLTNNDNQTPLQYIEEEDEFPELIKYLQQLDHTISDNIVESGLPLDGSIIDGHQITYSYQQQPDEISLLGGQTEEERMKILKEIAESDDPEVALRQLVTSAVHEHFNALPLTDDEVPSAKKRRN